MRISVLSAFLVVGCIVCGCEKDPEDPDDYIAFCDEYAAVVESHPEDCDLIGEELQALFEKNEAFLREAGNVDKDNENFEEASNTCRERLGAVTRVIDDACRDNERVSQALAFYEELTSSP